LVPPATNIAAICVLPEVTVCVVDELYVIADPYCGVSVVIELDADEAGDVPLAFVAVTVNVYEVAPVRPLTDIGLDKPDPLPPAGDDVAVNAVMADPPVAFAVYPTVAVFTPVFVAEPIVGACGIVVAVMLLDAAEGFPVPAAFVPVTVKVYAVADCRPVTVKGEDAPVAVYPPGEDVTV
jgi:hypothetical protein